MNKVVHATAELFVNVALTSYKDGADYWRRASRLLYSSWLIPVTYSRGPRSCSICLAHITSRRKKLKPYFEYWQSGDLWNCALACGTASHRMWAQRRSANISANNSAFALKLLESTSLIRFSADHRLLYHRSTECRPGGRAELFGGHHRRALFNLGGE
jgi:hypothetical protein